MIPTLAELDAMDRRALAALWVERFGARVPPKMSRPMQRRFLAQDLQAVAAGDLPRSLAARFDRIAAGTDRRPTLGPAPGGRLLREWNGITHVVDVTDDGFRWNDTTYRSMSAVARAITGARWSGPRFFGLREGAGR